MIPVSIYTLVASKETNKPSVLLSAPARRARDKPQCCGTSIALGRMWKAIIVGALCSLTEGVQAFTVTPTPPTVAIPSTTTTIFRIQDGAHCRRGPGQRTPRRKPTELATQGDPWDGFEVFPTEDPPLLNTPVYSLATCGSSSTSETETGAGTEMHTNMNILTYASPVGITPTRKWCLALYRGTQTHENFMRRGSGVLQVLSAEHAPLVYLLGGTSTKASGRGAKAEGCAELGFSWRSCKECDEYLLPGCLRYVRLRQEGEALDAGDHDIVICTVEEMMTPSPSEPVGVPMSTQALREAGVVSEKGRAIDPGQ